MTDLDTEEKRGTRAARILVMGVGSSGARAVSGMHALNPDLNASAIDTDSKVLESLSMEKTIHVLCPYLDQTEFLACDMKNELLVRSYPIQFIW